MRDGRQARTKAGLLSAPDFRAKTVDFLHPYCLPSLLFVYYPVESRCDEQGGV
jgi:hypothetical protein